MNNVDLISVNANVIIATGVTLIVLLLVYIAFYKDSTPSKKSKK